MPLHFLFLALYHERYSGRSRMPETPALGVRHVRLWSVAMRRSPDGCERPQLVDNGSHEVTGRPSSCCCLRQPLVPSSSSSSVNAPSSDGTDAALGASQSLSGRA